MTFGENRKGHTFAFTTFSPFESGWALLKEIVVLWGAHRASIQKAVRSLAFLHYGHFTRVPPGALRRAGIDPAGRLRHGGFLFNSAYNGDAEVYFRGFSEDLRGPMNDLWEGTTGWDDASPYAKLDAYIRRYCRDVDVHVNAYPSFATDLREALLARSEVDELLATAVSSSDAAFEEAYCDAAFRLWGNAR